jgi:hypothetical protein
MHIRVSSLNGKLIGQSIAPKVLLPPKLFHLRKRQTVFASRFIAFLLPRIKCGKGLKQMGRKVEFVFRTPIPV